LAGRQSGIAFKLPVASMLGVLVSGTNNVCTCCHTQVRVTNKGLDLSSVLEWWATWLGREQDRRHDPDLLFG